MATFTTAGGRSVGGAEEIARFGDRVLVRIAPRVPASVVEEPPLSGDASTDT